MLKEQLGQLCTSATSALKAVNAAQSEKKITSRFVLCTGSLLPECYSSGRNSAPTKSTETNQSPSPPSYCSAHSSLPTS